MTTINSNLAAASAQRNLSASNSVVQDSIARLSSGNRIIKASDDVAGLAIGTSIKSTVTSLEIASLNTQQASAVLSIADGALSQIGDILNRMKSLAVQANSGSLSSVERGYLNQEFTALTSEIDRIVGSTNFNGITLLDGTIAGDAGVSVDGPAATSTNVDPVDATVTTTAPVAGSQYSFVETVTDLSSGVIEAGDINITLTNFDDAGAQGSLADVTFTEISFDNDFQGGGVASTILSADINGKTYTSDVITADDAAGVISSDITFTASDGSEFVIDVQPGQDLDAALPAADGNASTLIGDLETIFDGLTLQQNREVAGLNAPATGTNLQDLTLTNVTITSSNFTTSDNTFGEISEFSYDSDNDILATTINGRTFNVDLSGNLTIDNSDTVTLEGRNNLGETNNETLALDLTGIAGSFNLATTAGQEALVSELNDLFGVTATGTVTTSAYSTLGDVDGTNVTAVDVSSFNDASYQSEGFGTFTVVEGSFIENGGNEESVTFTTTLGDKTYNATLTADANTGTFAAQTLTFTSTDETSSFDVSIAANGTIGTINEESDADAVAANITAGLANVDILQQRTVSSVDVTQSTGTILEGLTATSATITSNNFDTVNGGYGDIGNFSATAGSGTSNQLQVVANGTTYSATDIGGEDDTLSSADGTITLIGRDAVGNDNGERFTIDISGISRSIDLTNQDELDAVTNVLDNYFGVGSNGSGGLSFQVGSATTDIISVTIANTASSSLFVDDSGEVQTLSIDTQENAQDAIDVLDNAISSVISQRASVGASISRSNFAAANLEVSIANQDSARSNFLDANIAEESTAFAAAQVKVQASVATLAQANQLPQNLLQLLQ
jgi:flagellin